ncbi:hypothetical protein BD410DRAFT_845503 [Rickenella mellea]|uniref:Uncharacterized protein n=1 Tax=Rickenella mellea TaxID=50990 RepID=A0A4Y7PHV0_9AGAM|nr:hypothetical protein BD410DRAFT_845503 [Rickenella mellea]
MAGSDNSTTSRAPSTSATKAQGKSNSTAPSTASNGSKDESGKTFNTLSTVESAKIYLIEKGLATTGQEYTPTSLSTTLIQIAQSATATPKTVKESIRAVAILLQDLTDKKTADAILTYITIGLSSQFDKLQKTSEKISESSDSLKNTSSKIHSATSNLEYESERLTKCVDELHVDTHKLILNIEAATSELPTASTPHPIASTEMNMPIPSTATYASILQSQHPPDHLTTIARSKNQTHQVLVDVAPGAVTNGLQSLDKATLVSKANTALDLMGMLAEDKPSNSSFLAARRLKNGGVVYDMSSPAAAAWLKSKDVMKAFLESFGEFVPVTLDLENANACAEIEKDNNLPPLSILSAKWIKPISAEDIKKKKKNSLSGTTITNIGTPGTPAAKAAKSIKRFFSPIQNT